MILHGTYLSIGRDTQPRLASGARLRQHAHLSPRATQRRRVSIPATAKADPAAQQDGHALTDLRVACYSSQKYVHDCIAPAITATFPNTAFVEAQLDKDTAALAKGYEAVVLFVNDDASTEVAEVLHEIGVRFVAMRCAGFDKVDVATLNQKGIRVARVPTYSPESVAEHSVALAMALNRNIVCAHNRVMQGNYTLSGLIGLEICRKTVGIIGTGAIGTCAARIWHGFGANIIAFDVRPNPEVEAAGIATYHDLDYVLGHSDILTLHCPLNPGTFHLLDRDGIQKMKDGAILINCSRGGLVNTAALVDALESGKVGGAAMDVYEHESKLFFQDFSQYTYQDRQKMKAFDRQFQLLISFPNVIITPHTAFLTHEALRSIGETTVQNLKEFALGKPLTNEVTPQT